MKQLTIMNRIINAFLFIVLFDNFCYPQNTTNDNNSLTVANYISNNKILTIIDTISWSNDKIIIEIPKLNYKHSNSYEEGFFQYFIIPIDSATITIHCGSMVKLPLTDLTKYILTGKFILDKDVQVLRGYFDSRINGVRRRSYFREENYFKFGITVIYENVNESKLSFYDNILNNIKIISTKKKL